MSSIGRVIPHPATLLLALGEVLDGTVTSGSLLPLQQRSMFQALFFCHCWATDAVQGRDAKRRRKV